MNKKEKFFERNKRETKGRSLRFTSSCKEEKIRSLTFAITIHLTGGLFLSPCLCPPSPLPHCLFPAFFVRPGKSIASIRAIATAMMGIVANNRLVNRNLSRRRWKRESEGLRWTSMKRYYIHAQVYR